MQRRLLLFVLSLLFTSYQLEAQAPPIGQWREHLPWSRAIRVIQEGNTLWCASPWSLFSIDKEENSTQRYTKVNGLSATGIADIGWDDPSRTLVIAYQNSIIDLWHQGELTPILSLANSTVQGDKTPFRIHTRNGLAYLGTGLGIIVLDLQKAEVRDTYIIGTNGARIAVTDITSDNQYLYASTPEGLKRCLLSGTNAADFRNWTLLSGSNGLPRGTGTAVAVLNNQVIFSLRDTLYRLAAGSWSVWYTTSNRILSISPGNAQLIVGSPGTVILLNTAGLPQQVLQHPVFTTEPRNVVPDNGSFWIADAQNGLSRVTGNNFVSFAPSSPDTIYTGPMITRKNTAWASPFSLSPDGVFLNRKGSIGYLSEGSWTLYNRSRIAGFDSLPEINTIVEDPAEDRIWGASYGGGLFSLQNNTLTVFKQNSPLRPPFLNPGQYRVSGLAFDTDRNLWVSNYGATQSLHARKPDGNWVSFSIPLPLADNAAGTIIVDDLNQKWIQLPRGQGLVCFNHGSTLENPADDRWKWYRAGAGNGNLPDNEVLCMAKDRNSFMWIGTKNGIGIIQCPQDVFTTSGCPALLPVVQEDNFAGYLFKGEEVQAIAVDGADRKWVGTKNGVWLISADAEKTIYRFTEKNSPLPANDVKHISIDPQSGEVFFVTTGGTVSFRGTATAGDTRNNNVLVFPNPVPPDYTGTIAIRGLVDNAIVKITEPDGRLVFETRALGGQAIWNGRNYKGQKISSGVYLVLIRDEQQREKAVTKIVFIGK